MKHSTSTTNTIHFKKTACNYRTDHLRTDSRAAANIGYKQWRIPTHEIFFILKQIPQARKTSA